jgi:hypothetical protein
MFILLKPGAREALRDWLTRPRQHVAGDDVVSSTRQPVNTRSQP